jgi:sulfoxide reductase heme-binding subunit YedZ
MTGVLATSGPMLYWYLTRSTGAVALLLLTLAVALGVADVGRLRTERWPRFVVGSLHRNISLLALAFLVVHILTAVLDGFASISLLDAVVPFIGSYRPLWLGLGAISFDLFVAVILTSLVRARLGYRAWRAVHWLAYASWPIALVHGFGTGSDAKTTWLAVLSVVCVAIVVAALIARVVIGWPERVGVRAAALGATGAFIVFMALWLPQGPLGSEWARRAGTPTALLPHADSSTASVR